MVEGHTFLCYTMVMSNAEIKVEGQNDGPKVRAHCGPCHDVAMNFTDVLEDATSIPIWLDKVVIVSVCKEVNRANHVAKCSEEVRYGDKGDDAMSSIVSQVLPGDVQ